VEVRYETSPSNYWFASQVPISLQASLHSSSRTESSTRSHGLFGKLWGKDTKSASAQGARQSLNSASPTSKSRVQDLSDQTDQVGEIVILDMVAHVMIFAAGGFNTYCSRTPPKSWQGYLSKYHCGRLESTVMRHTFMIIYAGATSG